MTKQELQVMLGNNLRRARQAQNLTIEQVAEQAGISTTFYSNLEWGNKIMSLPTLYRLMEVLCVSPEGLLLADGPNEQIRNIEMLLRGRTPEELAFIEKLIRLCVTSLPKQSNSQEVTGQNEYTAV